MNTIIVDIDEAAEDLHAVVYRLRAKGDRAMLIAGDKILAELVPFPNPESKHEAESKADSESSPGSSPQRSRYVRSPITGHWVVAARPGERKISSEEIYEMWRGF
jgi:hypothetical protein